MNRWMLLTLASLCASCMVALTPTERTALRSVSIEPNLEVPAPHAPSQGFYIAEPASNLLRESMTAVGIDPMQIVREAFAQQVRSLPGFPPLKDDGGDAVFHLKVLVYGLEHSGKLLKGPKDSFYLKPVLSVNASLQRPDGKVIWTGRGHVTNMSSQQGQLYHADALENPELAREALVKAATLVAEQLVARLREAP